MNKRQAGIILSLAVMAIAQITMAEDAPKKLTKPLKIYLLAGQSNMQGKAQDFTIARMALSPESKELHDKLVDETGKPKVHENVSAVYFTKGSKDPEMREKKGKLSTGFGENLGPELAFGVTLDEHVDGPILIIKVAFGGKSLRRDFRPPSECADAGNPAAAYYLKKASSEEKEKALEEMKTKGAPYYRLIMEQIRQVLADPSKYCDAYDPKAGYEIVGFGWFQGFNDLKEPEGYTGLMANFIRDVRKDLNAPKMPFVIGVIGIGGDKDPAEHMVSLRKEQAATAETPEFKGNVAAVPTACFWDNEMVSALERANKSSTMMEESKDWVPIGKPEPKDRIWRYTSFNLDEDKQYRELEEGEKGDIRILTGETPEELKSWLSPDFDTSSWQKGPAPVGKIADLSSKDKPQGEDKANDTDEAKTKAKSKAKSKGKSNEKGQEIGKSFRSPWGEGNMLVMKTTFTCERDDVAFLRLWINATGSYMAYLNGTLIDNYPWVKNSGDRLRAGLIDGTLLKKGANELAVYGNFKQKGSGVGALDAYLEGLPKDTADKIKKEQDALLAPRDRELIKGKSNAEYHYLGSAYTYSLIGEAMAKALLEMEKGKK
jgi:Carbohydrate esterase, sialic acid-specific acetylesterase